MKITFIPMYLAVCHSGKKSRAACRRRDECGFAADGTRRAGGGTEAERRLVPFYREQGGAREEERSGMRDGESAEVGRPYEELDSLHRFFTAL